MILFYWNVINFMLENGTLLKHKWFNKKKLNLKMLLDVSMFQASFSRVRNGKFQSC